MHLVMCGCEYAGTTTLGYAITRWAQDVFGTHFGWHDHFKIPHLSHPPGKTREENAELFEEWAAGRGPDPTIAGLTSEQQKQILALDPIVKEMFQRYHMDYHVAEGFYTQGLHHNVIGMHIDEAVYASHYFGYGGSGEYGDRRATARRMEEHMLHRSPNHVLILVKSAPEIIRSRVKTNPHENQVIKDEDVEYILQRFEEEYENSLIPNRFTIDTGNATVEESLAEFVEKIRPFLSESDKALILAQNARKRGDWI